MGDGAVAPARTPTRYDRNPAMLRTIETLRPYALCFSAPFTLLWARDMALAPGLILVALHACVVMLYLVRSSQIDIARGMTPRLTLALDRDDFDADLLETARPILGVALALLALALLITRFWMGALTLIAIAIAMWKASERTRDKHMLIELAAPALLLAAPALLLRAPAWRSPDAHSAITASALAASMLGAAMLGLLILLCLIRDREQDIAAGAQTTATKLTRAGCLILAVVWGFVVVALAAIGSEAAWWTWVASVIVTWSVIGAVVALAARRDGWGVGCAVIGFCLTSLLLLVTTS